MDADRNIYNGVIQQLRDVQKKQNSRHIRARYMRNCDRMNIQSALREKDPDMWHVLIDYRNNNEVLKRHAMSAKDAHEKNKVLAGTGLGWSRIG